MSGPGIRCDSACMQLQGSSVQIVKPKQIMNRCEQGMFKTVVLALTVTCCSGSLLAQDARKIALLVGISDYFDKNMEDLSYAENDVTVVGEKLQTLGFETNVITGRAASRENVNQQIDKLFVETAKLENDAVVFIMFSGHGQQLPAIEVDPATQKQELKDVPYFCPRDAKPFDKSKHAIAGKTASQLAEQFKLISLNEITRRLERESNSTRNLLVVDACRNTPGSGKAAGVTNSTARNLPPGIRILFSAKGGQKSWESADQKIKHGVMSHFLVKGLSGEARNRRDQVTWSRLVNYVREEVEFAGWRLAGGADRKQNPHAIMNSFETIVLGTPKPNFSWLTTRLYREDLDGTIKTLTGQGQAGVRSALQLSSVALAESRSDEKLWFQLQGRNLQKPDPLVTSIVDSYRPQSTLKLLSPTLDQTGGRLNKRLLGHVGAVHGIAVSADGRFIASGGSDDVVRVWDAKTLRKIDSLYQHDDTVGCVRFSPDGSKLVTGSNDNTVKVFLLRESGAGFQLSETLSPEPFEKSVTRVSVSRDGKFAAAVFGDKQCYVWSLETGKKVKSYKAGGEDTFRSVDFSPYADYLVTGMADGRIWVYNTKDWSNAYGTNLHKSWVEDFAFTPDGKYFYSAGHRNLIHKWRMDTGAAAGTLKAHTDSVRDVTCSPDGKYLASRADDGMVMIWTTASDRKVGSFYAPAPWNSKVEYLNDSKTIVTGSLWGERSVKLWDGRLSEDPKPDNIHDDHVRAMVFAPDPSGTFYSAGDDKTIKVWDWPNQRVKKTLTDHKDAVWDLAVSADGSLLASASDDKTVILWRLPEGQAIKTLQHEDEVRCLAFSPDGKHLATAGAEKTIRIWDLSKYTVKTKLTEHSDAITALAYSPNGRHLASAGSDEELRIWDPVAGKLLHKRAKNSDDANFHDDPIYELVYSPDGRWLASGSSDDRFFLWDTESYAVKRRLYHDGIAYRAAFLPDGKTLATASFDKKLRLWNVQTGKLKSDYEFDAMLGSVGTDGKRFAVGDGQGRVHLLEWAK